MISGDTEAGLWSALRLLSRVMGTVAETGDGTGLTMWKWRSDF